ncbi:MAG: peroxiredoxin family protein [Pirellulaceae bacterium]
MSWSDTPRHLLSVHSPDAAWAVEAEPQKKQASKDNPPKDNPAPPVPTTAPETTPAKDAVPQEKPEASTPPAAVSDDTSGRDPIRQLSRQYARRRPTKDRAPQVPPPPASEIHEPILVLSKDHRDTCLVFQGDAVPPGTLPDAGGQGHSLLESLGKKLTVIVFWNANNPYSLDQFQEMQNDIVPLCEQGVQAIAIHVGPPPQDYAQLCSDNGQGILCLLDQDQKYFAQWASRKLPRTYLLDAAGKIQWLDLEYSRSTRYDLRNALHFFLQK